MDKDLLRLVILGVGGVLIVGVLFWNLLANRKPRQAVDFLGRQTPLDSIDSSLIVKTGDDDFDVLPLDPTVGEDTDKSGLNSDVALDSEVGNQQSEEYFATPAIIQFSIIAKTDLSFKGDELVEAFKSVGLQYTDSQVFQHLDIDGLPEYTVASIVEPGTFPARDLASFSCPGIVFFMQPAELDNLVEVYDQMLACINDLSSILDGIELDSQRQPLTIKTVQIIRNTLDA